MSEKAYSLGIVVGRFQVLHTGHIQMISKALELCDEVGIFIGSAQESGTQKNPFSYEMRHRLLTMVFGDRVRIFPLSDIGVGNVSKWGEYVLSNVEERLGRKPDLLVSGKETRRIDWFDFEAGNTISELYVPKTIDISATQMRQFFIEDERTAWTEYVDPAIAGMYDELRNIVLASKDNTETDSI